MKFLKIFLATLLAMVVGTVISWVLCLVIFVGMAGSMGNTTQATITPQTIIKIDFAENISDAPTKNPMAGFDYTTMSVAKSTNLLKVLQSIESAKNDERVKGLYLNFTGIGSVSSGAIEEIRAAIADFKQSGKFVVAYNEAYSQAYYYLASVADKVYVHPHGAFDWKGLAFPTLFMKGALDKLGLKAEVFRPTVCKYKSAVEPYIRKNMSPENRAQMQMITDDMWGVLVDAIAESRGLDAKSLKVLADKLAVTQPEDALKHNFVDGLIYEDEMEAKFAEYGVEKGVDGKYNIISLGDYMALAPVLPKFGAPAVGVIYAEGSVLDGAGDDDNVYSVNVCENLRKAREDKNIKAVVFRVNSPGGSALASDVIWREVELLRKEKPVIVSMGSYAASGGYYISSSADAIIADKLTITGSIGVFGMLLEGENALKEKLGITSDVTKSGSSADLGAGIMGVGIRKFTDAERKVFIRSVDKVYETFTTRVSEGRNLPMATVLDISQGRVWSGARAVSLGLADANGGLREAIAVAVDKAGIADNFRVVEVLEDLSPVAQMMQALNVKAKSYLFDAETLEAVEYYNSLKRVVAREGVQAYCPYTISIL